MGIRFFEACSCEVAGRARWRACALFCLLAAEAEDEGLELDEGEG
jgi:hypothetical protein